MTCPTCDSDRGEVLGVLGRTKHFRCRDCGMTYSLQLPARRAPTLHTRDQTRALLAGWGRADPLPERASSPDLFIEFPDTDDYQDAAARIRKSTAKASDSGKPMWEVEFIPKEVV